MSEEQRPDWGQLTADALNRATNEPEFKRRYKKWLEDIGPENWTPVAKADYEAMVAEEAAAGAVEDSK